MSEIVEQHETAPQVQDNTEENTQGPTFEPAFNNLMFSVEELRPNQPDSQTRRLPTLAKE